MSALAICRLDERNRAIGVAFLVSLTLHVMLFLALPALREAQTVRNEMRDPVLARILQPPKPAVSSDPVPEPKPSVPSSAAPKPRPRARPEPARAETAQPTNVEPAVPRAEAAPAPQAGPAVDAPLAAPSQATTNFVSPAPPAVEAPDAGTLAQYRLAIISAAKRFKRYPHAALDNHWQGKVEMRIAISTSGAISTLSVRASTGHAVLDQQAIEMMERAKEMVQLPAALRGREFTLDIPIIFSLRDAD